jgi:hypothetical protein
MKSSGIYLATVRMLAEKMDATVGLDNMTLSFIRKSALGKIRPLYIVQTYNYHHACFPFSHVNGRFSTPRVISLSR